MLAVRQLKPLDKAAPGAAPDATGTWLERHTSGTITFIASAAFVLLYVTLDAVSYVFPYHPFPVTPWNPNAGLAIAMTIAGGPRYAPAVIIATLLAEIPLRTEGASLLANLAAGLGLGSASAVQHRSPNRAGAASMPDAAWPISRFPPYSSRANINSRFRRRFVISTLERQFTVVRLHRFPPDALWHLFRDAHDRRF